MANLPIMLGEKLLYPANYASHSVDAFEVRMLASLKTKKTKAKKQNNTQSIILKLKALSFCAHTIDMQCV